METGGGSGCVKRIYKRMPDHIVRGGAIREAGELCEGLFFDVGGQVERARDVMHRPPRCKRTSLYKQKRGIGDASMSTDHN